MTLSVAVLTTGSEILDGRVVDTNSNYVAKKLSEIGGKLVRVLAVDDNLEELLLGLRFLHEAVDIIITSGGLGPTEDDLTRDMAAAYLSEELVEFPAARAHLEQFYAARKRTLDPSNIRQAYMPKSATMIDNPIGTAPGFIIQKTEDKIVCSLSGVPKEFKRMFDETVFPVIVSRAKNIERVHRKSFRLFGLPESVVGKEVVALQLAKSIDVSYRAAFPEVHLVFKGTSSGGVAEAAKIVSESKALAPFIFTDNIEESFSAAILRLLQEKNETVAVAESCSGGGLGALFTSIPGASRSFLGGIIAYSNELKIHQLRVPEQLIAKHGAVSADVAYEMAKNVRELTGASYGISITGIAGPSGGSEEKPVGTFFVSVASVSSVEVRHCLFVNDRSYIQRYSAFAALELLRRMVTNSLHSAPFPSAVVGP